MTTLTDLVGIKSLDAVDFTSELRDRYGVSEDSQVCRFRLDGVVYEAVENPDDGYRSHMEELTVSETANLNNVFAAISVFCRHRTNGRYGDEDDILELIDVVTGKVVLEVGTDSVDDYYPSFVANFQPENMITNEGAGAL